MKEFIFIYGEDCAKCHQLKPHCKKWADEHWYKFKEMQYAESGLEITSLPMAQLINKNGEMILDMEAIVNLISNKEADGE